MKEDSRSREMLIKKEKNRYKLHTQICLTDKKSLKSIHFISDPFMHIRVSLFCGFRPSAVKCRHLNYPRGAGASRTRGETHLKSFPTTVIHGTFKLACDERRDPVIKPCFADFFPSRVVQVLTATSSKVSQFLISDDVVASK